MSINFAYEYSESRQKYMGGKEFSPIRSTNPGYEILTKKSHQFSLMTLLFLFFVPKVGLEPTRYC